MNLKNWNALEERIVSLNEGLKCLASYPANNYDKHIEFDFTIRGILSKECFETFWEIKNFSASCLPGSQAIKNLESRLSSDTIGLWKACEDSPLHKYNENKIIPQGYDGSKHVFAMATAFMMFKSEIRLDRAVEFIAPAMFEKAMTHLKWSLYADTQLKKRWIAAWKENTEPRLEQLGAIHLLGQNLWGFKISTAHPKDKGGPSVNEETDLILPATPRNLFDEMAVSSKDAQLTGSYLILTEWKKVQHLKPQKRKEPLSAEIVNSFQSDAIRQIERYRTECLGNLELTRFKYVVLVSEKPLEHTFEPERTMSDGSKIRTLNLALNQAKPSAALDKISKNLALAN